MKRLAWNVGGVVGVVLVFNAAAILAWRLLFAQAPLPFGFLLVNTLATAGLILLIFGLARTGSSFSNGSGDYAVAFSTATGLRVIHGDESPRPRATLRS